MWLISWKRPGSEQSLRHQNIRTARVDPAVRRTNIFNTAHARPNSMSLEMDHYCPVCEETRTFWLTASTELHLGEKTKWRCPECDYGLVLIGEGVDSSAADA